MRPGPSTAGPPREVAELRARLDRAEADEASALAERKWAEDCIVDAELAEPGPWNDCYRLFVDFVARHGHQRVPQSETKLNSWVRGNRRNIKRAAHEVGSLRKRPYRIAALDRIGFVWEVPDVWPERLEELKRFKAEHGHLNIMGNDGTLGRYARRLRVGYWRMREGRTSESGGAVKMTEEKVRILEGIGFPWRNEITSGRRRGAVPEVTWDEYYRRLVEFKERRPGENLADYLQSDSEPRYRELAAWAENQKEKFQQWSKGKVKPMYPERFQMLRDVGIESVFVSSLEAEWHAKYNALLEYKRRNGTTVVSKRHEDNPALAYWAATQSKNWSSMDAERRRLLEEAGFAPTRKRRRDDTSSADDSGAFDYPPIVPEQNNYKREKWRNAATHTLVGRIATEEGQIHDARAIVVIADTGRSKAIMGLYYDGNIIPAICDTDLLPDQAAFDLSMSPNPKHKNISAVIIEKGPEQVDEYSILVRRDRVAAHFLLGGTVKHRICDTAMLNSLIAGRVRVDAVGKKKHNPVYSVLGHNLFQGRKLSAERREFVSVQMVDGQLQLTKGSPADAELMLALAQNARERCRVIVHTCKDAISFLATCVLGDKPDYYVSMQCCLGGRVSDLSEGRFYPCKDQLRDLSHFNARVTQCGISLNDDSWYSYLCLCGVSFDGVVPEALKPTIRELRKNSQRKDRRCDLSKAARDAVNEERKKRRKRSSTGVSTKDNGDDDGELAAKPPPSRPIASFPLRGTESRVVEDAPESAAKTSANTSSADKTTRLSVLAEAFLLAEETNPSSAGTDKSSAQRIAEAKERAQKWEEVQIENMRTRAGARKKENENNIKKEKKNKKKGGKSPGAAAAAATRRKRAESPPGDVI